jgi:phage terminase small subunit
MSTAPSRDVAGILLPPSPPGAATPTTPTIQSPRRQAFITNYLETGNGTKAAILAGYGEKSAAAAASRLLRNPEVRTAIDAELLRRAELGGITATYVLNGIRAIAEDSTTRNADKLRAYELLGKHLKLFSDNQETDDKIEIIVTRSWEPPSERPREPAELPAKLGTPEATTDELTS